MAWPGFQETGNRLPFKGEETMELERREQSRDTLRE